MRLLLKFIMLSLALMFGVFFGIDSAEQNIQEMQGTEAMPDAFDVSMPEDGNMAVSVFGQQYETESPVSEEQIEEGRHFLSHFGNKAGEALQWLATHLLDRLGEVLDKLTS